MNSGNNQLQSIFSTLNGANQDARKAAEDFLLKQELTPTLIQQIFQYIKDYNDMNLENKTQAALYIKNVVITQLDLHDYTKRDEDRRSILNQLNQQKVKKEVLQVIFTLKPVLSKHLVALVVALAHFRYTKNWKSLLQQVKYHMNVSGSPYQQKMAIEILRRIFRNHRHQIETPNIAQDVINTLTEIATPLMNLFDHYMKVLFTQLNSQNTNATNVSNALTIIANSLDLIHSLNSIDLPEQFEDNIGAWMNLISHTLDIPFNNLNQKMMDEAQKCQKRTLGIFNLYAGKYFEDFKEYIRPFFDKIWNLVLSKQMNEIPQRLLTQAIMSVDILIRSPDFKKQLGKNLFQIFQFLILPALRFTEDDKDQFQEQPNQWLKYDLLLHNQDTQRQQAMKLSASIARAFPSETQAILGQMQEVFMDPFRKDPQSQWKNFADFINVVLATVVSRSVIINNNVKYLFSIEKVQVIYSNILEDLLNPELNYTDFPILRATQLKMIVQMKEVPQIQWILRIFESLCGFLKCDHNVLQSYASVCLETLLTLPEKRDDVNKFTTQVTFYVKEEHIKQHYIVLLESLACTIEQDPFNIYAIRSLYRVLRVAKTSSFEVLKQMPQFLAKQLRGVKAHPISAEYNYVLCEIIAYIFKLIISTAKDSKNQQQQQQIGNIYMLYLNQLRPTFIQIIQNDCLQIIGYVFQIEAYLLNEQAPQTPLPNHSQYVKMLLVEEEYFSAQHIELIPAFMKYLIASLRVTPDIFFNKQDKVIKCLFAALIKYHFDDSGFSLLSQYIVSFSKNNQSEQINTDLLLHLLMKLFARQTYMRQKLGTVPLKFSRGMTKALSICFLKLGIAGFQQSWEKQQKQLFEMVLKRYGEVLPCLDSPNNKKIGVVSFTNVINDIVKIFRVHEDKMNFFNHEEVFKNIFKGLVLLIKSFETIDQNVLLITDDMFVLEKFKVISFEGTRYQPIYCAQLNDNDPTGVQNQFEYYLQGMKNLIQQLREAGINLRQHVEVWIPDDLDFFTFDSVRAVFNLWDQ